MVLKRNFAFPNSVFLSLVRRTSFKQAPDECRTPKKTVVISANTSWNLVNFRGNVISALRENGFRVVAMAPRDAHSVQLEGMVDQYRVLNFRSSGTSPFQDAILFLRYLAILREYRPSIFLGFTIKPNVYGSLAANLLGVAVINNVSGLGTAFIKQGVITQIASALYRRAFRRSSTIFFQNDDDRQLLVAADIVQMAQTRLLPGSGVDLERFTATPLHANPPFTFLLIGRLLWDKGLKEYVDAARIVKRRYPDIRFQILGFAAVDNRTAVPLKTLHGWIDEGIVEHLGAADDVRPYINAADCIVLPSYREGLPRSLLEAAAMARPVIATDVPGNRDVVVHRSTGILCRVRDAASLARAMLEMVAMPLDARREMATAARLRVEGAFDVSEVTKLYLDAIRRAL